MTLLTRPNAAGGATTPGPRLQWAMGLPVTTSDRATTAGAKPC
jgi:hypothetical protein